MEIFRNNSNNLHREGAPAIQCGDLTAYYFEGVLHNPDAAALIDKHSKQYYWRGIIMSEDLFYGCITMSPQEIMEMENVELRRAVLEKVGYGHLESACVVLSETGKGATKRTLMKLCLQNDEDIVFVKVLDGTEKQGIRNVYYLRVPPNQTNADEAVAWTFGETVETYKPKMET